jgi:hypothetical protein
VKVDPQIVFSDGTSTNRREDRREPARPERVCPNCGSALIERKCKLLCPDPACGYYMSCSDFY